MKSGVWFFTESNSMNKPLLEKLIMVELVKNSPSF
jgi:hypothetical protein